MIGQGIVLMVAGMGIVYAFLYPLIVLLLCAVLLPSAVPLIGALAGVLNTLCR